MHHVQPTLIGLYAAVDCLIHLQYAPLFTMSTTETGERHKSSKHRDKDGEKDKHRSHDRDRDRDSDRKHKKRRKHEDDYEGSKRKHKHRKRNKGDKGEKLSIVDDDVNDDDMWVEKNIDMDGERVRVPILQFISVL